VPESFLRTLRTLATCYQAFGAFSAANVRQLGLTPAQFDVLATLGNTAGMSCRELGERTLITKGTLTGVLDRLAARRLIRRSPSDQDRRSVFVQLTPAGAQNSKAQGIGVHFKNDESGIEARRKIEGLLGGVMQSNRPTHTM